MIELFSVGILPFRNFTNLRLLLLIPSGVIHVTFLIPLQIWRTNLIAAQDFCSLQSRLSCVFHPTGEGLLVWYRYTNKIIPLIVGGYWQISTTSHLPAVSIVATYLVNQSCICE